MRSMYSLSLRLIALAWSIGQSVAIRVSNSPSSDQGPRLPPSVHVQEAQVTSAPPEVASKNSSFTDRCGSCWETTLSTSLISKSVTLVNSTTIIITVDTHVTILEDGSIQSQNSTRPYEDPDTTVTWVEPGIENTFTWPTQYLYANFKWTTSTAVADGTDMICTKVVNSTKIIIPLPTGGFTSDGPINEAFLDEGFIDYTYLDDTFPFLDDAILEIDNQISQVPVVEESFKSGLPFCPRPLQGEIFLMGFKLPMPYTHISVARITESGMTFTENRQAVMAVDVPFDVAPLENMQKEHEPANLEDIGPRPVEARPTPNVASGGGRRPGVRPKEFAQTGLMVAAELPFATALAVEQEQEAEPSPVLINEATITPQADVGANGSGRNGARGGVVISGQTVPIGGSFTLSGGPVLVIGEGGAAGIAPPTAGGASPITVAGQKIEFVPVGGSSKGVVINGNTIQPGEATTLSGGTPIVVGNDGSLVVGLTPLQPGEGTPVLLGDILVTPIGGGSTMVFAGQTLVPGGKTLTLSDGRAMSLGPGGVVHVGETWFAVPTPVTMHDVTITPIPNGNGVVIKGRTILPGESTTLEDGKTLSVGSGGVVAVDGTSFTLPQGDLTGHTTSPDSTFSYDTEMKSAVGGLGPSTTSKAMAPDRVLKDSRDFGSLGKTAVGLIFGLGGLLIL